MASLLTNGKAVKCATLTIIQAEEPAMGARAVTFGTQWIGKRMVKTMRLIDADALECDTEWSEYHDGFISYSQMEIDTAPTIDAVEVVHGEWKRKIVDHGFNADWVCSECGYRIKTDFVDYNFCPNCGSRMKGAER